MGSNPKTCVGDMWGDMWYLDFLHQPPCPMVPGPSVRGSRSPRPLQLLKRTQQYRGSPMESSVSGALVDHYWRKGGHYIKQRNFEFGCGISDQERLGPGKYFNQPRPNFFCGVSTQGW